MCTIDLKHCCDETPGEQVRNYYRQQGYSAGFKDGYDAGLVSAAKVAATNEYLETLSCPNCNEKRGCSCDWQEDERTGN